MENYVIIANQLVIQYDDGKTTTDISVEAKYNLLWSRLLFFHELKLIYPEIGKNPMINPRPRPNVQNSERAFPDYFKNVEGRVPGDNPDDLPQLHLRRL